MNIEKKGKYLRVVGDYNDADYVEKWTNISHMDLEDLNGLLEEFSKLKGISNYDGNLIDKEYLRDYVPIGPEGLDVHTLKKVQIITIQNIQNMI